MTASESSREAQAVASKPSISVRQFRPSDHATMVKMYSEVMALRQLDPRDEIRELWRAYTANRLRSDLADVHGSYMAPGGNFWVAIATDATGEEQIAGMAGLELKDEAVGEVRSVFVGLNFQRLGVGRLLLDALKHWAAESGVRELFLTTLADNVAARGLYAAAGFALRLVEPPLVMANVLPLVRFEQRLAARED